MLWIGVDVGGTFTDLVVYDSVSCETRIEKVSSTVHDQAIGILAGFAALGFEPRSVERIVHGSTVATNVALERNGARVVVFTTKGFRDVLEVGRGERIKMYDARSGREPPLIPRSNIIEMSERMSAAGLPLIAPNLSEIEALLADRPGLEAIAVCFLHSYCNSEHELSVVDYLRSRFSQIFVTASAEVLREPREYERFATTALNAYVAPPMRTYLTSLESQLATGGFAGSLHIMTSNGGTASARRVMENPVSTIMSGPAAGVTGALYWSAHCGLGDVITFDMGGTSTDTCLIKDGTISLSGETSICGLVSRAPQIEISSVGSGGGSIARVGAGGFLTVGPESAGSRPGPACYGRGGVEATLTDANLIAGRLGANEALGRDIRLSLGPAEKAVERLAVQLGIGTVEMAEGIVSLAVARTTGAIREISIMRGHDSRNFTLLAYGGAGPLHAALAADELESPRVVVPPYPGAFSAFGLLTADSRAERRAPMEQLLTDVSAESLRSLVRELTAECEDILRKDSGIETQITHIAAVDLRYRRQASHLVIAIPEEEAIDPTLLMERFTNEYKRQFGHTHPDPVELCGVRVSAARPTGRPKPARRKPQTMQAALIATRRIAFNTRLMEAPVYSRDRLPTDATIAGPCIVEEYSATAFVPPHYTCRIDAFDNLIMERRS